MYLSCVKKVNSFQTKFECVVEDKRCTLLEKYYFICLNLNFMLNRIYIFLFSK